MDGFQNKPLLLRLVDNCLNFGTFPEIVLGRMGDNIKTELLSSHFESIVQKDCIIYNTIRNAHLFYRLVNYLLQNTANRFSPRQLSKAISA